MPVYTFDKFRFDAAKKELWHDSQIISLQPKVAAMLAVFLENHGELVSREELMQIVWEDTFVEESSLRFCIHSLRKVLRQKGGRQNFIETVPKRGYRFAVEVAEEDKNSLGRYKILEKIGVGGMGEVFLANDPELERNVAIKVLLPEIAEDDERIRRFKLEAKAVSALNHPNIVTIFEIGQEREKLFIAYEFIEGETLREKIRKNQLTVSDSINTAEQVAHALSAAHKAGIIHRDIKPENIMIRTDGYVKILDFGLAKRSAFSSLDDDETLEWIKTQKGMILGSVQYMSPEQSRGLETGARTDIWSLGVVLFEMLSGNNPFEGETVSDSVAAILHFEPESISRYLQDFPAELGEIIEKALQQNPDERYQNIRDLGADLKQVRRRLASDILTKRIIFDRSQEQTIEYRTRITDDKTTIQRANLQNLDALRENDSAFTPRKKRRIRRFLFPLAAFFGIIFLFWLYNFFHLNLFPDYYAQLQKTRITRLTTDGNASRAAISDDRKWIAFVSRKGEEQSLIARELATGNKKKLTSVSSGEILQPTFVPDKPELYFVIKDENEGNLYRSNYRRDEFYGKIKLLSDVDSRVSFSPDGSQIAFVRQNEKEGGSSVFVSPSEYFELAPIEEKATTKNTQLDIFNDVVWQNDGEQLTILGYINDESTRQIKYGTFGSGWKFISGHSTQVEWTKNENLFSLMGNKVLFSPPTFYRGGGAISSELFYFTSFDITADGKALVVTARPRFAGLWLYDPKSKEKKKILGENTGIESYSGISQMPGGRILFAGTDIEQSEEIVITYTQDNGKLDFPGNQLPQIYSANPDGTDQVQFIRCEKRCAEPVATSGGYILYRISYPEKGIWRAEADGSHPVQLTDGPDSQIRVTPDGKTVFFMRYNSTELSSTLMKVSIDGGKPVPLNFEDDAKSPFNIEIFENGKYAAYLLRHFEKETSKITTPLKIVPLNENEMNTPVFEHDFDGYRFKISPDGKWIVYSKKNGLFRIPLNFGARESQPEQIFNTENGPIADFIWLDGGDRILYLQTTEKSDIFLIEDTE